jgi:hypothetical protein
MTIKSSSLIFAPSLAVLGLSAAPETELKDEAGKTIVKYVIKVPEKISPADTTDPAKQVDRSSASRSMTLPRAMIYFLSDSRSGGRRCLTIVLLAAASQGRKFGNVDHERTGKLIAWAKKTYPINPRRVYMYGKREGSKISMEVMTRHPDSSRPPSATAGVRG